MVEGVAELNLVALVVQTQPNHHIRVTSVFAAQLVRAWGAQFADLDGVGGVGELVGDSFLLAAPPVAMSSQLTARTGATK